MHYDVSDTHDQPLYNPDDITLIIPQICVEISKD